MEGHISEIYVGTLKNKYMIFYCSTILYNFFYFTDGLILTNGLAMIFRILEFNDDLQESALAFSASWDTILFVGCELKIYTLHLEQK
jgi:hypothetical protein